MSENENINGQKPEENFGADNPQLPELQEIDVLKARATKMGITFHPNIGVDKLKAKIELAMKSEGTDESTGTEEGATESPLDILLRQRAELDAAIAAAGGSVLAATQAAPAQQPVTQKPTTGETTTEKHARMRREAAKLIRVRVNCMNPAKSDYEGEIFTVSNSVVGTFRKYVPYNNEEGWHIPQIIYDMLQEKQCQIFVNAKGPRGQKVKKPKLIKEYAIEVLDPLTRKELEDLAQRQAMAHSIDD